MLLTQLSYQGVLPSYQGKSLINQADSHYIAVLKVFGIEFRTGIRLGLFAYGQTETISYILHPTPMKVRIGDFIAVDCVSASKQQHTISILQGEQRSSLTTSVRTQTQQRVVDRKCPVILDTVANRINYILFKHAHKFSPLCRQRDQPAVQRLHQSKNGSSIKTSKNSFEGAD